MRRIAGRPWATDAAMVAALLVLFAAALVGTAARQPAPLSFGLGAAPPGVLLDGFYGTERNAGFAYRWARPHAAISLPVDGPALYRVTLAMQDAPTAPTGRVVRFAVNGEPRPPVTLGQQLQERSLLFTVEPRWGVTQDLARLEVTLDTAGFIPPGDNRALGPLVAWVTVAPVGARSALQPALLIPNLLLLVAVYAALRLAGASSWLAD